mmetsp:Transcript_16428/g.31217  ORF Transcript_16428/g.31217 Transcript_16428/m.31217 type:complete len:288 (+) Transcript_16428:120-983(+)|eukprot:scaffold132_cov170-Amphora_coffeaeformis.AAC.62
MFRSNRRRRQQEITQLAEETSHDLKNLRDEMALARKKESVRNLRDEMKLARKLSFRRIDQASMNVPPFQKIECPDDSPKKDEVEFELNFSPPCSPLQRYPTTRDASRLPSARHFSILLDDESENQEEEDRKPAGTFKEDTPTTIDEDEPLLEACADHHHDHEHESSESSNDTVEIEIFPGVFKPLRGSQETQHAWDNGLCAQVSCVVCEAELAYVWDCEFVICPVCRAVVPVDASVSGGFDESLPSLQSSLGSSISSVQSYYPDGSTFPSGRPRVQQRGVGLGIRII